MRLKLLSYILVIVGLVPLFLACSGGVREGRVKKFLLEETITFSDSVNTILIENNSDSSATFSLDINKMFPLTNEKITQYIDIQSTEINLEKELAAWQFVSERTFHSQPYSSLNWQHQILLFLNSIGGGFCDDRASVLAEVWRLQGYSSRIIGLEGHVVPEVFVNGKWSMYDPDGRIYYCDSTGAILSVEEIINSGFPKIISDLCDEVNSNPLLIKKNPFSDHFYQPYVTIENNHDVTDWHLINKTSSTEFILPGKSALSFIYNERNGSVSVRIELTPGSRGRLKVPLVPYSASGMLDIVLNNRKEQISDRDYKFSPEEYIENINVINVEKVSVINYLINPKLDFLKEKNEIHLQSDLLLSLSGTKRNDNSPVLFGEAGLFFDRGELKYRDFLADISNYKGEAITTELLVKQFRKFLRYDKELSEEERVNLENRFIQESSALLKETGKEQRKILEELYPISAFYLFLGVRYNRVDLIKTILAKEK